MRVRSLPQVRVKVKVRVEVKVQVKVRVRVRVRVRVKIRVRIRNVDHYLPSTPFEHLEQTSPHLPTRKRS